MANICYMGRLGKEFHGTRTGFKIRRCRCDECIAWGKRENRRVVEMRKEKNPNYSYDNYWNRREAALAAQKRWRDSHPEENSFRVKEWRATNRDKVRGMEQRYREANPEKYQQKNRDQRRKRFYALDALAVEWLGILQKDPCCYCGAPVTDMDHIIPIHSGGASDWDNFTASCQTCNASKGTADLLAFLWSRKKMT